ncbi:MAG: TIGR03086 family metal-binding protein [Acidimicrobiia bacterium]
MAWTSDTVYLEGLDFLSGVVGELHPLDWERPSPCAGWRAVDVLGHIGAAVEFGTRLLTTGEMQWVPPADPPGSVVEGDPAAWWNAKVAPAKASLEGVDLTRVVQSPMGERTIAEGLSFPAIDLYVHAWDLGAAAGIPVTIPDEVVEFARGVFAPMPPEMVRSPGIFGTEIAVGDESPSDEFLAWTGRDPHWRA